MRRTGPFLARRLARAPDPPRPTSHRGEPHWVTWWHLYRTIAVVAAASLLSLGTIGGTYLVIRPMGQPVAAPSSRPFIAPSPTVAPIAPDTDLVRDLKAQRSRSPTPTKAKVRVERAKRPLPTPTTTAARPTTPSPTTAPTSTTPTPTPTRTSQPAGVVMPTAGVVLGTYPNHTGVDIGISGESDYGRPVRAAYMGRVVEVHWWSYSYGYHVIVQIPNGLRLLYGHLSRIDVRVGGWLSTGEHLGHVGHTGNATGSHLHFEVIGYGYSGTLAFLRGDLTPFRSSGAQTVAAFQAYARNRVGSTEFACLLPLWNAESGWNRYARNPSSGAYGIPQALPASKMGTFGSDWTWNGYTQIRWGLSYIEGRYGSPCAAWAFFQAHNWY